MKERKPDRNMAIQSSVERAMNQVKRIQTGEESKKTARAFLEESRRSTT